MQTAANGFLEHLRKEVSQPKELSGSQFAWADRFGGFRFENGKAILRFFSDGLVLAGKLSAEKTIKQAAEKWVEIASPEAKLEREAFVATLQIFMERREKSGATSREEPKQQTQTDVNNHRTLGSAQNPFQKRAISGVKHILAVASGKGGVGKSTVSVNLALSLHNQGYRVGLLDADIYGPSQPMMLGVRTDPKVNANNKIEPPEAFGIKLMSFGFFAADDSAVIWRGPMVMKALQQFFYDVEWGELDFLVIDLPPGTGDAQLTLVQSLPISGAVIVTTPQNVALLDAVKGVVMFRKTEVPILGVIENMTTFVCPSCGIESHIFGKGGAEKIAGSYDVPVLGHIPLVPEIRAAGDNGTPLASVAGHPIRMRFAEIAENVTLRLAKLQS